MSISTIINVLIIIFTLYIGYVLIVYESIIKVKISLNKKCVLCGHIHKKVRIYKTEYGYYVVVRCNKCGYEFLDTNPWYVFDKDKIEKMIAIVKKHELVDEIIITDDAKKFLNIQDD
jgi:uncharacterized Zn finger protein